MKDRADESVNRRVAGSNPARGAILKPSVFEWLARPACQASRASLRLARSARIQPEEPNSKFKFPQGAAENGRSSRVRRLVTRTHLRHGEESVGRAEAARCWGAASGRTTTTTAASTLRRRTLRCAALASTARWWRCRNRSTEGRRRGRRDRRVLLAQAPAGLTAHAHRPEADAASRRTGSSPATT